MKYLVFNESEVFHLKFTFQKLNKNKCNQYFHVYLFNFPAKLKISPAIQIGGTH